MNGSDDDIRWLSDQQPEIDLPEPEASSRARAELMAHATATPRIAAVVAAPAVARISRPRRRRRVIAMATAVAAVAVVGFGATLAASTRSGHNGIDSALSPGVANAQQLVLLADQVAAAPLTGNATLVVHKNVIKGSGTFTGADLYLDDGRYYYAETRPGSPPRSPQARRTSRSSPSSVRWRRRPTPIRRQPAQHSSRPLTLTTGAISSTRPPPRRTT